MTFEQLLFSKKDQIALLEQWYTCVEFGMTTKHFCQKLADSGTATTKKIGQAGLDAPGRGQQFTDVLEGWLSPVVISTLVLSERNGQLLDGLDIAMKELEGGQGVMFSIFRATLFPISVLLLMGYLGVYISGEILDAGSVPPYSIGGVWRDFVSGTGTLLGMCILGLLIAASISMPIWTGTIRRFFDSWPLFSHYRVGAAGNLLATLANLSKAGMNLKAAIEEVKPRSTLYLKSHLKNMEKNIETESNPGKVLDTGLLLVDAQVNLDVMGDIAPLTRLLEKAAQQHQKHSQKKLASLTKNLPLVIFLLSIALLLSLVGTSVVSLVMNIRL